MDLNKLPGVSPTGSAAAVGVSAQRVSIFRAHRQLWTLKKEAEYPSRAAAPP